MSHIAADVSSSTNPTVLPLISILTICKNAKSTIGRALESVSRCQYPRLEYVVVDGGSTDGTLLEIERYRHCIDKLVSGPDRGISDALNKAVELSSGQYHLIVHADDELLPESVALLASTAAQSAAKVVSGSVQVIGKRGLVRKFAPVPQQLVQKMSVPHMGSLIQKQAWAELGGYDLRRRIAMDHLLMLRIFRKYGPSAFVVVDTVVANYFLGGTSDRHVIAGFREVRDNLVEQGAGALQANVAFVILRLKAFISSYIGRQ